MNKDKYVGMTRVGERGQIVIPKEAREMFNILPGDNLVVLCDKAQGIAIVKPDIVEDLSQKVFGEKK